jgi:hypothetical protein
LIIGSSIKLIYDSYLIHTVDEKDERRVVSSEVDMFFTVFFAFESMMKSVGMGFAMDKGSYLRESWN